MPGPSRLSFILSLILCAAGGARANEAAGPPGGRWWADPVQRALSASGTNQSAIVSALVTVPASQREAMAFLVENMPARDLQSLSAAYLLENVALAEEVFARAPWRDRVPREIFLNDILPYASVNESRDDWRKLLYEKCSPLVTDCRTPTAAAIRLNQKLFQLTQVKYSQERRRADQGPLETMSSGKATCTGLSILLVDACRSVGVPARVVGTPMWTNLRGNHTWVEIWDGQWHFTGAAEQDPNGLDHGWFKHDAAQAVRDNPRHAIYATSFKQTGLPFPLAWANADQQVPGINVTEQYTPTLAPSATQDQRRLLVQVLDQPGGRRVAAKVLVTDTTNHTERREGISRDESADRNDILSFPVARQRGYEIRAEFDGRTVWQNVGPGTNAQEIAWLFLSDTAATGSYCPPNTAASKEAQADSPQERRLRKAFGEFFAAPATEQERWKFPGSLERFLQKNEPAARRAAWQAYQAAPIHAAARQDFDANQARFDQHLSPYTVKTVGTRPPGGWALFIAMHGGGNEPQEVNDSQWQVMQRYYRDHPETGGYRYVALRAPNNTWNGFYDVYVYPLVANLIRQFLLFDQINPNKVFLMGYSHGGYGAFAIGPKMPDRFAAIHASAAAPTDGETTPRTLRNTVFSVMVGEKDTMYGRYDRAQKFRDEIAQLRGQRTDIYPVTVRIVEGNGHTGLPDRDRIAVLYPATRDPVPRDLNWLMTDQVIHDFFWLHTSAPGKKQAIEASCHDNRITVTTSPNVKALTVLLDGRLVDFDLPVSLQINGTRKQLQARPNLRTLATTLLQRGDPELAFTAALECPLASDVSHK